ncbi:hypothetical protein [Chromobacterium sphagni]|uniref:Uncharacterized protein n=1 Tax=Chromobacterium sphagni TaxID=1903179 RepID=A0ABX3CDZ6_9NEIS|nr:hypothetical protein [Chromobacterium sphagni]OHX20421.1 hypothetical protein BI344_08080 [Chromobacterium sphagni]
MKYLSLAVLALPLSSPLMAAPKSKPKALAQETLQFINDMEANLQIAIRIGDKYAFYDYIEKPTLAMADKWPAVGSKGYDDYVRCQFAVQDFRVYAQDQFKAKGMLPKNTPTTKEYLRNKRECQAALKA